MKVIRLVNFTYLLRISNLRKFRGRVSLREKRFHLPSATGFGGVNGNGKAR
jgi:hypothetical protein